MQFEIESHDYISKFTMRMTTSPQNITPGWRLDAARIIEQLFPSIDTQHWDLMLDLRELILTGKDWKKALNLFLELRQVIECDCYLPMYRLRQLLGSSLRLELNVGEPQITLHSLLLNHKSLESIHRAVHQSDLPKNLSARAWRITEVTT